MRKWILRGAVVIVAGLLAPAGAFAVGHDTQYWGQFITMGKPVKEKPWGVFFEYQIRHSENEQRLYETLIRPAVFYELTDKLSVFLGYLSLRRWDFSEAEQRPWQQLLYVDKFDGWGLTLRLRQEQRFFQNSLVDGTDDPEVQHRTRLLARVLGPLLFEESPYALTPFVQSELFWHWNTWGNRAEVGFNQNRLYIGMNKRVGPVQVETGFLSVHLRRRAREDITFEGLFLNLIHRW